MANFLFRSVGELWAAYAQAIVDQVLTTPTASASFNSYATGPGGGLGWGLILQTAENPGADRFAIANTLDAPGLEYGDIRRDTGIAKQIDCNFTNPGDGFVSFETAALVACNAKASLMADVSGGAVVTFSNYGLSTTGGAGTILYVVLAGIAKAGDVVVMLDVCINRAYNTGVPGITEPSGMVYPTNIMPAFASAGIVINVPQPLDIDVGINAGQAIYSVNSKTTTILP